MEEKENNQNDVFLVHPDKTNALTHKVLPIGSRMLQNLFDYGSLSKVDEEKYIKAILQDLADFEIMGGKVFYNLMVETIVEAQIYIKETVNKNASSVSLRDIKRVKKIFIFYCYFLAFAKGIRRQELDIKLYGGTNEMTFSQYLTCHVINFNSLSQKDIMVAYYVTIGINYYYRIIDESKFGDFYFWVFVAV